MQDDQNKDNVEIFSTDDEKIKLLGEVLSNDSSRKILQMLFKEEMTANQISQGSDISLQLVKYHLNKMQDLGIVEVSKVEKNSKEHDMKYYSPTKFAVVILPSKVSEKAKESKSLLRSFKTLYKFAGIGIAAVASLFTLSYLQEQSSIRESSVPDDDHLTPVEPTVEVPPAESRPDITSTPEPIPTEPESEAPTHGGVQDFDETWNSGEQTLEETLGLARRKIEAGEANPASGSGTPFFDAGDAILTIILIGIMVGGLAAFFFWRAKRHSKLRKTL